MAVQNKITVIAGVTGDSGGVVAREFKAQGAKLVLVGTNACAQPQRNYLDELSPESYLTVVADLAEQVGTEGT